MEAGLARKKDLIKILGRGDIDKAINIEAHKCSASALKKIEAAGGSVTLIGGSAEEAVEAKVEKKKAKKAPAAEEVAKEVVEDAGAEKNEEASDASDAEQA